MTINLALEYIPRRMEELGFGNNYYIRFRHLVLQGHEEQHIAAFNQLYILVEEPADIIISSELGLFHLRSWNVNEMQYEHQGQIKISNPIGEIKHIRFIQVIFKTIEPCQTTPPHTTLQK